MSKTLNYTIKLGVVGKDTVVLASNAVREYGKALGTIPSRVQRAQNSIVSWASATTAIQGIYTGVQQLSSVMSTYIQKANGAAEAQVKLTTVMRQRMSATEGDVKAINEVIAKQTELGVVGGTVQRSGLQQLATFASHRETLATLLPAMNNLLVQQRGLNATSEDAVGIGNLMGKVLQGQTSALKRVGITFSSAEETALKYGDEQQRAAVLAKVITNNVGEMNKEMAKTDAGKAKQMANAFSALEVKAGSFLSQYQNLIVIVGQLGMGVAGISSIVTAMTGIVKATGLATIATKGFRAAQVSLAAISPLITAAINGTTLSVTQLRAAIRGTILSLGLIGVAYYAISTAIQFAAQQLDVFGDSADDANAKLTTMDSLQKAAKEASDNISSSFSEEKNQIKSLNEIINSNTSSLAEKKAAISELQSIIPGYDAVIDNEGKVHVNTTNAIYDHIKALDVLQKAMAAYKVGSDIESAAAKASFNYYTTRQNMQSTSEEYHRLKQEYDNNKGNRYYRGTATYSGLTGITSSGTSLTAEGSKLVEKLNALRGKLRNQFTELEKNAEDLKNARTEQSTYSKWRKEFMNEGTTTKADRDFANKAINAAIQANGDPNKAKNILLGRSDTFSMPEKGLDLSKNVKDMNIGEVESQMQDVKKRLSDKTLSKKEADDLGGYYKTLAARDKELRKRYGMGGNSNSNRSKTYKTETQKIDEQLKIEKDKFSKAGDSEKATIQSTIQSLEKKKAAIELSNKAAERPTEIKTSDDADKELDYLNTLEKTAEKKDIPAIEKLIYNVELFKASLKRPEKLDSLTAFDNEIAYQQKLLEGASASSAKNINAEIDNLEALRDAFKNDYAEGSADWLNAAIQRKTSAANRTGNDAERNSLKREIKELQNQLDAINADYEAGSIAGDASELQKIESRLQNENLSVSARIELLDRKDDLQRKIDEKTNGQLTIPAYITPSYIKKGSIEDYEQSYRNAQQKFQRIEENMNNGLLDRNEARKQVSDLNKELSKLGKGVKPFHLETGFESTLSNIQNAWGALEGIGNGIRGITDALSGNKDAWSMLTGVVDGALQVMSGIETVAGFIEPLITTTKIATATSTANAVAVTAQGAAATGAGAESSAAAVATMGITVPANKIIAASWMEVAAAEYMAAHAAIPFAGFGIGAGFAASAKALVVTMGNSAFATGGIVPGSSFSGDKVLARVNSGEMILNARQQARLFALADGRAWQPTVSAGGYSTPVVMVNTTGTQGNGVADVIKIDLKGKGRTLYGVMANDKALGKKIGRKFDI